MLRAHFVTWKMIHTVPHERVNVLHQRWIFCPGIVSNMYKLLWHQLELKKRKKISYSMHTSFIMGFPVIQRKYNNKIVLQIPVQNSLHSWLKSSSKIWIYWEKVKKRKHTPKTCSTWNILNMNNLSVVDLIFVFCCYQKFIKLYAKLIFGQFLKADKTIFTFLKRQCSTCASSSFENE